MSDCTDMQAAGGGLWSMLGLRSMAAGAVPEPPARLCMQEPKQRAQALDTLCANLRAAREL
jgi:hypothetical protein